MKALSFIVAGRVQQVGYRDFVEHAAKAVGVRGWVRNRRDKTVEVLAAGTEEQLEQFELELRRGPSMARVDSVTAEAAIPPAEPGFTTRHSV